MREIKFRAWLVKEKCWYDLDITDSSSVGVLNVNYEHILCQFTGLKDKNDKEIYEGDIIHYELVDDGKVRYALNYEVAWNDFESMTGKYWDQGWVMIRPGQEDRDEQLMQGDNESYWEVIGNIYENPNLLKETK